jgi:Methylamine utilisation protein MauE
MSWAAAASIACRMLIGTVFAVSATSKMAGPAAWQAYRSWLSRVPLPLTGTMMVPVALAAAEAAVVPLVAMPMTATAGMAVATALCLMLTVGLAVAVRRGLSEPCRCFGASSQPLGGGQVVRNAALSAIAGLGAGLGVAGGGAAVPAGQIALTIAAGLAGALLTIFAEDIAALLGIQPASKSDLW